MKSVPRSAVLVICTICFLRVDLFPEQDSKNLEREVNQVFAAYDKPESPGCALGVAREGQLVYKRGYGSASLELGVPITPQSVFYLGSISKQFTAASVVLAAEQGYLSLDDDVRKYIPELPSYGKTITLRHMLYHTSGLREIGSLLQLAGRNIEDIHPRAELLDLVSHQALNFNPGDEYSYSNTNYFLLAIVIERATGKPLAQFAEENIFRPLGMIHTRFYDDHTVVLRSRASAYELRQDGGFRVDWSTNYDMVGAGGLMSSVEDLVLWDRNFYSNKLGKGTLVREMETPGALDNGKRLQYGLGLLLFTYRGLPVVAHGGGAFGYRADLRRFPDQKFTVITLCNLGTVAPDLLASRVADIYLAGQFPPGTEPPPSAHEDPKPFAGEYRNAESRDILDISVLDGDLLENGARLESLGSHHFAPAFGWFPNLGFELVGAGAVRLTVLSGDAEPDIYERFQPVEPSADDLAQYAGEYSNQDLRATYQFTVEDGKLMGRINWQAPVFLAPTVRDEFEGRGTAFVFRRDSTGRVTGCDLSTGRIRNVNFRRTSG